MTFLKEHQVISLGLAPNASSLKMYCYVLSTTKGSWFARQLLDSKCCTMNPRWVFLLCLSFTVSKGFASEAWSPNHLTCFELVFLEWLIEFQISCRNPKKEKKRGKTVINSAVYIFIYKGNCGAIIKNLLVPIGMSNASDWRFDTHFSTLIKVGILQLRGCGFY